MLRAARSLITSSKTRLTLIGAGVVALYLWSAIATEVRPQRFLDIGNTGALLKQFVPPRWEILPETAYQGIITLQIALVGTTLGVLLAMPFGFLAARNATPHYWVGVGVRAFLTFFRAVPEIVFALILVPALGVGPFPAVVALALHNYGVLGKHVAEFVETSAHGPVEAVTAVGASRALTFNYGVLPQILANTLAMTFYRVEVGVRAVVLLGFLGAGGVGQDLFISFKTFRYQEVAVQVLVIMALVLLTDALSAWIRKRLI